MGEPSWKASEVREALKELDAALCQFLNCYSDPYTPKREWENETRNNIARLSKVYDDAYRLGIFPR